MLRQLGWTKKPAATGDRHSDGGAARATRKQVRDAIRGGARNGPLPVRETLANRHILLIGVTGFIGKVWLVDLLENIPNIGKITLLIRKNRTTSAQKRFQKIIEESPAFDTLQEKYGRKLGRSCEDKVEVVEGDVGVPGLGLDAGDAERDWQNRSIWW